MCPFRCLCRCSLVAVACERFFVSNLLFFLLCSVVFDRFSSFCLSFLLLRLFLFVVFFYFSFCVSSCFSLLVFVSLFSSKICLFMLVSFLPFSFCFDLVQQNISFCCLILIVFNISRNKFLFLWTFKSHFWYSLLTKISLFKFPFLSSSFLYLCFSFLFLSVDSFHVFTPLYVPS